MAPRTGTRDKMLYSAVELLRERGAAGVTVDAVLARSSSPRGSVYHHFPGGRAQLMSESLTLAGDAIGAIIEHGSAAGSLAALDRFGEFWSAILRESDFAAGCPVVSVAVGGSPDDRHLQPAVAEIFQRWHDAIVASLRGDGVEPARAQRLATTAVAAVEGAVILCRVQRSTAPLDEVVAELGSFFRALGGAPNAG
ncbi:TetR/AcrR family transcriptional regulator [Nocardia huaxiensis]|uniref:TetR/AcrR family transcriptional regulator n=1 Tax=Nocardia huaxiensis TaxID=2755382 RepID=UPI001E41F23E|nr:TetR/AcrR family transcriptional regulator [Nocardia huaxiensis]UFS95266.1 TetR/AcrR family transcriptional regulator [Nocardia huaxiensis]